MFKLNMDALRKSANDSWLMANAANAANLANESGKTGAQISQQPPKLAGLAKLAISQQPERTLQTEPVPGPASSEPPALAQPPAPAKPAKPAKRMKYVDWADGWRELDQAYQRHHFGCPQCKASGRGAGYSVRCGVGAALYRAYEDASEDRSALDW